MILACQYCGGSEVVIIAGIVAGWYAIRQGICWLQSKIRLDKSKKCGRV